MTTYYEHPVDKDGLDKPWHESTVLNSTTKILLTDDNLKPSHIALPAKYTEFHMIRGSDTLFLNIGESWAYGEALEGIGTAVGKFSFRSQVEGCFGPRIAEVMGWDLYQFAIPGNCNLYMHLELPRLLNHIATLGYKKVYVAMQMTENAREMPINWTEPFQSHPIKDWYDYPKTNKIDFLDWLAMYDEIFFQSFHDALNSFTACPIEGIMWRNFTKTHSKKRDYNFKFIEPTWITYTASLVNIDFDPPHIMNTIEFDTYRKNVGKMLNVDMDMMEKEMDKVSFLFDYIGRKKCEGLIYHNNHPSRIGHLVWAHHLIRQAGWKNI